MLYQIGDAFRKVSLVLVGVAIGLWLIAETIGGLPSKTGPHQPMLEQRRSLLVFALLGVPGTIWAFIRVKQGKQRTLWDE